MFTFAAAVLIGEPPNYPIIEAPFSIAIVIAAASLAYWLGGRGAPSWLKILVGMVWLVSIILLSILLAGQGQYCLPDALYDAQQNWIGVPAFAFDLACPLYLARTLFAKHVLALPAALGFVLVGLAIAAGVAFALPPHECGVA